MSSSQEDVDPVGDDHRHAGKRQFQRHGARGGERGMGAAEGGELLPPRRRRSVGLTGQSRDAGRGSRRRGAATAGRTTSTGPTRSATSATVSPKRAISRRTSLRRLPGRTSRTGATPGVERRPLAGGRAAARRAARSADGRHRCVGGPPSRAMHLRLERQDGEQVVDEPRHRRGARTARQAQTDGET